MKGYEGSLNQHSKQFGGSAVKAGHVEVHHTVEGDRRNGVNERRDYKSPLGNTDMPYATDKQIYEEAKNRAQSPRSMSESGIFKRFRNPKGGPI
jgi:hypothetical protein